MPPNGHRIQAWLSASGTIEEQGIVTSPPLACDRGDSLGGRAPWKEV